MSESKLRPRILVNATTLVIGGGVSVGVSFIEHACLPQYDFFEFIFAVTQEIYHVLRPEIQIDPRIKVIHPSPARVVIGHCSRSELKLMEKAFRPDIIYTLGLPSYTRFQKPEVGRYTNPWEIGPSPLPWECLPWGKRLRLFLLTKYRLIWARRAAFFETQTEVAKEGIVDKLGVPADRVKVIPNSCHPIFINNHVDKDGRYSEVDECNILCLAAPHWHKNLSIIPDVADALRKICPETSFSFVITLPLQSQILAQLRRKSVRLGVEKMIYNVDVVNLKECVSLYRNCHLVFLPTLLEVFSVTYLEAMAMSRPIVTTDLSFARSICGDAALYFAPSSPQDAAEKIVRLTKSSELIYELIERGRRRLTMFPDPASKHEAAIRWLGEIVECLRSDR